MGGLICEVTKYSFLQDRQKTILTNFLKKYLSPITMCGNFTCSKNTLIGLNIVYIFVGLLLIGVAAAAKTSNEIESLPVVGGIIACGIFLLFIAIVGLVGAIKHHQVMLFFYMVVLFSIFVIQFSVACACLGASTEDELKILENTYNKAPDAIKNSADSSLNCCGFYSNGTLPSTEAQRCEANTNLECTNFGKLNATGNCDNCREKVEDKVDNAFNASGGLGLFFSFTELVAIYFAHRLRGHLKMQTEIA